jgi:hypothetical protein
MNPLSLLAGGGGSPLSGLGGTSSAATGPVTFGNGGNSGNIGVSSTAIVIGLGVLAAVGAVIYFISQKGK